MAARIKVAELYTPVVADTTGFAKSLGGATTDAKGWAVGIGSTIATGGLAVVAAGAALAAGAVLGLGAAIGKMTMGAAAVQGTVNTFDKLVQSVGSDAVEALELLRASTRGMVADADLMAAGNKFLAMGIADTAEEAAKLAEVSTQLGMAMGEDATASMENFALMMANQSIPRLDSFGISSSVVRERIAELMEETEGLSREQAFNTAVMEQAAITMEKVGEQSDTASGSMSRIRTAMDNASLGIGQAFLPALESILEPISDIAQNIGPQLIEWAQMAGQWLGIELPKAIAWLEAKWIEFWPIAQAAILDFWVAIQPGLEWVRNMFTRYSAEYLPRLREAWDILAEGFGPIVDLWNDALKPAFDQLKEALGLSTEGTDEMAGVLGILQGEFVKIMARGLIDGLTAGVQLLTIAFIAGKKAVEWMKTALENVGRVISEVIVWIRHMAEVLGAIKVPEWLMPGSATPFELGLRGIADAMRDLSTMELPSLNRAMELTVAPAGGAMGGGGTTNYGGDTIYINDKMAAALYMERRRLDRIERIERS